MRALVRICVGDNPGLYNAEYTPPCGPPHHDDKLLAELKALPYVAWVRTHYGEPCLDIAADRPASFSAIVARFNEHGYELVGK